MILLLILEPQFETTALVNKLPKKKRKKIIHNFLYIQNYAIFKNKWMNTVIVNNTIEIYLELTWPCALGHLILSRIFPGKYFYYLHLEMRKQ